MDPLPFPPPGYISTILYLHSKQLIPLSVFVICALSSGRFIDCGWIISSDSSFYTVRLCPTWEIVVLTKHCLNEFDVAPTWLRQACSELTPGILQVSNNKNWPLLRAYYLTNTCGVYYIYLWQLKEGHIVIPRLLLEKIASYLEGDHLHLVTYWQNLATWLAKLGFQLRSTCLQTSHLTKCLTASLPPCGSFLCLPDPLPPAAPISQPSAFSPPGVQHTPSCYLDTLSSLFSHNSLIHSAIQHSTGRLCLSSYKLLLKLPFSRLWDCS